jgi:septal ring factor EnvC (AmiA/AmiB activator)
MTPEQLDAIEKEAKAGGPEDDGAGDLAAFLVDCRILPLVKALREAREERDEARAELAALRKEQDDYNRALAELVKNITPLSSEAAKIMSSSGALYYAENK